MASVTDSSSPSPSDRLAILPSTGTAVPFSAVPTQNVFATSDQDGTGTVTTTDESQGAGPIDNTGNNDGNNDAASEPDPGVELEDQTDPDTAVAPFPGDEESSTPTAALNAPSVGNTHPVESSVTFSFDSFAPPTLLPPIVIVPAGIPSSTSQFLATNPVAFPTTTPTLAPVPPASPSPLAPSPRLSSATFLASPSYGPPVLGSASSVSSLLPTGSPVSAPNRDLNHPNPASSSPQAERSKKAAVLAGFLILGTLGAVGVALLCSYCGLFRCCRCDKHRDRGFASAEEGLGGRGDPQKLVRVNLDEKWSIVPGSPPPADVEDFVEALPRDAHTHTLSCSTCPPDSLNGVRGGVPGGGNRPEGQLAQGWVFPQYRHLANANVVPQTQDESAMTHIAPSLAFAIVQPNIAGPAAPFLAAPAPVQAEVQTSTLSKKHAIVPGTTPPDESALEIVCSSGDSYMTCDSASKYSMASGRRASESGAESLAEDNVGGTADADTDAERPSTPEGSHSSSTTGSPSVLMTPEHPGSAYGGVVMVDAEPQISLSPSPSPIGGGLALSLPREAGGREESEWDVVAAYSYGARAEPKGPSVGEMGLPSRPMTPALGQRAQGQKSVRKKNVRERRATGVGIVGAKGSKVVGPVALGEKHVMVVHGA